jgi:hypothetical protein
MPADESHGEWQVTWGLRALNAAAGYLSDDREGCAASKPRFGLLTGVTRSCGAFVFVDQAAEDLSSADR